MGENVTFGTTRAYTSVRSTPTSVFRKVSENRMLSGWFQSENFMPGATRAATPRLNTDAASEASSIGVAAMAAGAANVARRNTPRSGVSGACVRSEGRTGG
jgi:hypothetical protein